MALQPRRILIALVCLALTGAGGTPRVYRNEAMRVRAFEAPAGWELAPQSSYPRLLASYSHHEGGKLTLSAQRVPAPTTALGLAEQSRSPLEKQGFTALKVTPDGERARLEADLDEGRRVVRQVYLVEASIGYVVTMIAPRISMARLLPDFEEAVKSLQLGAEGRDGGVAR